MRRNKWGGTAAPEQQHARPVAAHLGRGSLIGEGGRSRRAAATQRASLCDSTRGGHVALAGAVTLADTLADRP
jgi:hypothetical protein